MRDPRPPWRLVAVAGTLPGLILCASPPASAGGWSSAVAMQEEDEPLAAELEARAGTYRRIAAGMADAGERAAMESIAEGYAAEAAALRAVTPRSGRRRGRSR